MSATPTEGTGHARQDTGSDSEKVELVMSWRDELFALSETDASAVSKRAGEIARSSGCTMDSAFAVALSELRALELAEANAEISRLQHWYRNTREEIGSQAVELSELQADYHRVSDTAAALSQELRHAHDEITALREEIRARRSKSIAEVDRLNTKVNRAMRAIDHHYGFETDPAGCIRQLSEILEGRS